MKLAVFGKMLASWWTTAVLLLLLCAAYLFFSFGREPYAHWLHFLLRGWGLALYLGFVLNLLAASVRVTASRLGTHTGEADAIGSMDVRSELPASDKSSIDRLVSWIGKKGFRVTVSGSTLDAVRGRFSFLPGTVLRSGLVLLLISLLASVHVRETRTMTLHAGEEGNCYEAHFKAGGIDVPLSQDYLQVGDESSFLLEKAAVNIDAEGREHLVTPGFPTRIGDNYFRLVHIGYAQPFTVKTADAAILDRNIDLDILPPGKSSVVALPGAGLLTVSLEPDKTISKGLLKGRQYDLKTPFYRITLQSGSDKKKPVLLIKPGERRTMGRIDISAGRNGLYARLQIVHDPALLWLYAGFCLTFFGTVLMVTRFFWFRKEIRAEVSGGVIRIGYCEEFFRKWGIARFHEWKDELSKLLK